MFEIDKSFLNDWIILEWSIRDIESFATRYFYIRAFFNIFYDNQCFILRIRRSFANDWFKMIFEPGVLKFPNFHQQSADSLMAKFVWNDQYSKFMNRSWTTDSKVGRIGSKNIRVNERIMRTALSINGWIVIHQLRARMFSF